MFLTRADSDKKDEKKIKPTNTRFTLQATAKPQLQRAVGSPQKTVVASPVILQSSLSEPSTVKTVHESRRPTNVVTAVPAVTTPKKKKRPPPTSRPFRFGSIGSGKRRESKPNRRTKPPGDRRRFDLSYFSDRSEDKDGSTIVPITVTGTGVNRATAKAIRNTPSEVVVTASQGFASLSLIDRFTNAIGNSPSSKNKDDIDAPSPKRELAINPDPISNSDGLPPTGLVTTLGGTTVNSGLTTVHKTSVIGTYIKGQYAQVLLSTSRIFQTTAVDQLNSGFETVKSVIKGSATQFITPDISTALPLEELFSSSGKDRNARLENEPVLFKRRGQTRPQYKDDPFVDGLSEDDLQRSGTDLRPSFRPVSSPLRRQTEKASFGDDVKPTTFRPRFTPSSTFRFGETRTASPHRLSLPRFRERERNGKRPFIRRRPGNRPKLIGNRDNNDDKKPEVVAPVEEDFTVRPTPTLPSAKEHGVETLHSHKSKVVNGPDVSWIEVATVRQMHTFRVGTKENTRFVTYTRTFTHSIEPTVVSSKPSHTKKFFSNFHDDLLEKDSQVTTPLFENILEKSSKDVATLPPIDIGEGNLNAVLQTVTESYSTTETMLKTSVLPVMKAHLTMSHTLTQTYLITKIVTAIKTLPPVDAFDFIPENSLNEFNDKLLAEGTENEQSLLPGELEYDENSGTRVRPPPGFNNKDPELADIVAGKLNFDALDEKLNPELSAALRGVPQLESGQPKNQESVTKATPQLSPEQLQQLAYLQLINPYAALQGFNPLQPQVSVTSTPVTVTTDVTTTTTRVLRVIFNARPIYTTLTSTEVVRTTLTTHEISTVTASPQLPFGAFPFPGMPFAAG